MQRALLEAFWFGFLPCALALAGCHFLIPSPLEAQGPLLGALAALGRQPLAVFAGLLVLFACVLRAWRARLPGLDAAPSAANQPETSGESGKLVLTVAAAALLTLLIRVSVFEPHAVVSTSMLPSLEPGDWLACNKLAYGLRLPGLATQLFASAPRRGDVIAFRAPPGALAGQPERLVKRVIGLPGDHISFHDAQPLINGWAIPSCDVGPYAHWSSDGFTYGRLVLEFLDRQAYLAVYVPTDHQFGAYTVQPGEVFVLGDNRNNSSDSRAWHDGHGAGLPLPLIEGRTQWLLLSIQADGQLDGREVLRSLHRRLRLSGVDTSQLERGITRCLAHPPATTLPPAWGG